MQQNMISSPRVLVVRYHCRHRAVASTATVRSSSSRLQEKVGAWRFETTSRDALQNAVEIRWQPWLLSQRPASLLQARPSPKTTVLSCDQAEARGMSRGYFCASPLFSTVNQIR